MTNTGPGAATIVAGGTEPADAIAAAVLAVPGVAGLHGGTFGEIATYLPRRRVAGVRETPDAIEVNVTLRWRSSLRATTEAARAAVAALPVAAGRPVHVVIRDLVHDLDRAPARQSGSQPGRLGKENR